MSAGCSVLVLRHEPFEHLGHLAQGFADRNIAFRYKDLGEPLDLADHQGLVVMGGPQSVNDASAGLSAEMELIRAAIHARIPVLGICLGAQLIAKVLGARVYRNDSKEIGWASVFLTSAGAADPLFSGLDSPTTFFHWHGETFDLPQGAHWLAYSALCRHQAFRYGSNVYGVQFHPEITAEMVIDWCSQPINCGELDTVPGPIDPYAVDSGPLANRLLEGWLTTFKS